MQGQRGRQQHAGDDRQHTLAVPRPPAAFDALLATQHGIETGRANGAAQVIDRHRRPVDYCQRALDVVGLEVLDALHRPEFRLDHSKLVGAIHPLDEERGCVMSCAHGPSGSNTW